MFSEELRAFVESLSVRGVPALSKAPNSDKPRLTTIEQLGSSESCKEMPHLEEACVIS